MSRYKTASESFCDARDEQGYPCRQATLRDSAECEEHIYRDLEGLEKIAASLRARLRVVECERELILAMDEARAALR